MSKNIDIKKVFWIYLFAFLLAAFSFRADAKTETKSDKTEKTVKAETKSEKKKDAAKDSKAKKGKRDVRTF